MSKQTMFRRLLTLSLTVAVAGSLAACSGAGEPGATDTAPAAETNKELHAMLPQDIQDSGVIRVGTEAFYPPYDYFADDEETIIGLDPDIVHALGDVLGVEMKIEHMAWDGLLPALDSGRVDMLTGAFGSTPERLEKYDFVSYYSASQGITTTVENPKGVAEKEGLCGLNVSVLDASFQMDLLTELNEDMCVGNEMTILPFQSDSDALQQLQNGRADVHVAQYPVASFSAKTFGDGTLFAVIDDESFGPQLLGKVFRKDSEELRDAIHAAMNELITSGVYDKIVAEHELSSGAITESEINKIAGE